MAIELKSAADIAGLREAGRLVAEAFALLQDAVRPGTRLRDLDRLVAGFINDCGAQPLYLGYRGNPPQQPPFPGVICTSVNFEICHGLPDERLLREGDIIGIDIGLRYRGYCGDAAVTYAVGQVKPAVQRLLDTALECLNRGIAAAQPGNRLGDIGAAIQGYAEAQGCSVVREMCGHGLGRELHEDPPVPHFGTAGRGIRITPGMVFTIEPMINAGGAECRILRDGWTIVTADRSLSAQFEHALAITPDGPEILSRL